MQNQSSFPAIYEEAGLLRGDLRLPGAEAYELPVFDITYLHYHRFLELGWCVSGAGECYVEDRAFPFTAGDVQIIFPYQRHFNRSEPGNVSRWFFINLDLCTLLPSLGFFDPAYVTEWMENEMGRFGIFSAETQPTIHGLTVEIVRECIPTEEPALRHRERLGALLCQLLAELSRCSVGTKGIVAHRAPDSGRIAPALHRIQQALRRGTQPGVGELAELCSMSEPHFRRVFRQVTGSAPKEYILCAAVHRAQQLLLDTEEEIVQIAAEVGFSDVSGLNRRFLRQTGCTPSAFRQRYGV